MTTREILRLEAAVFLSGAALMGLEIVGARVLAPVFGTSVFVWGSLITVFLASLAAGAALGGRLADRRPEARVLANLLVVAGALTWLVFSAPAPVMEFFADAPVPDRFRSLLAALALFAAPCTLLGMVTTFAVRLAAREISTLGAAAGRLSAISTAGSIAGTFGTTFFLIPAFSTRPILFAFGLALVVSAWLVPAAAPPIRLLRDAGLAAGAAVLYLLAPESMHALPPVGTLVYEKETAYHRIRVVDQGVRRLMYFNNLTQGFVPLRAGEEPGPNYSDGMLLALALPPKPPQRVVVIGLGAGMIPSFLSARAPEVETTTIEIDPEVVDVAHRFFSFAADANDRVLIGDGRRELSRQVTSADAILVDAFFADSVPFHLLTKEFYELCRDRMSPDGVIAANFVGGLSGKDNALFWAAVKTLEEVFPRVYIFSSELAQGRKTFAANAMVMATRSPLRLDRGTIGDRAGALAARLHRPPIRAWAAGLYDGEMRTKGLPVLTDDFSPTDALQQFRR
jgi:spermidine synthase